MIIIGKNSIQLEYFDMDEHINVIVNHKDITLIRNLGHEVQIEPGVTVYDLFVHMGKEIENIDIAFDSQLGGYNFIDFYREAVSEPRKGNDEILDHAVFYHDCSLEDGELLHDIGFIGMGISIYKETERKLIPYSLEYSTIRDYSYLPLVIDTKFVIYEDEMNDIDMEKDLNEEEPAKPRRILFESVKPMTLYDILSAILLEVAYYGTPDMRERAFNEIQDDLFEIVVPTEHNISAILDNIDIETKISNLDKELKDAVVLENYELCARIRNKINELKKQNKPA